jgi:hypothetical protein
MKTLLHIIRARPKIAAAALASLLLLAIALASPHLAFALACIGTLFSYLCRLDVLSYREHKPAIVLMHVAFGASVVAALWRAVDGLTGLLDVSAVLSAALWIGVSYEDWRVSVPEEYASDRAPLVDEHRTAKGA